MSVALIDKNGELLGKKSNVDTPKDDDSKELAERKIEAIPVTVISKEHYISICNKAGNLETTYEIVEDENCNSQLVVWRKVGDLDSTSGLIQLSTPLKDIEAILNLEVYMHTSL